MKSMEDLFHNALQDVYYAEKQLLRTLPKLAENSSDAELEKALTNRRRETEHQVRQLEDVFDVIGHPSRKPKSTRLLSNRRRLSGIPCASRSASEFVRA
jgi:ferritin-like metal-binding protein YciE